jgi:galactokinase
VIDTKSVRKSFFNIYQKEPRIFRAPGRVNLIGEHTDYNDGFVLPMAIDRYNVVAAALREDRTVRVTSLNVDGAAEFDLDGPNACERGSWGSYVEGVAKSLEKRGVRLKGADLVIQSNVPIGAGLSSSAALEISVGLALLTISGVEVDRVQLALAGQAAEHNYAGINCGIMDQYIASLGRRDHALLIDCRTFDYTPVPVQLADYQVVICDTRVKHQLSSSEYNTRRSECEQGVKLLQDVLPGITALRDVSLDAFRKNEALLPEPIRSRCRHVVTENARTLSAADELKAGNISELGRLMIESHRSLRDDYQVSCRELDIMVEVATRMEGVPGARMTGGGFGGCTVNIVRRNILDNFKKTIQKEYSDATGITPNIYISDAASGAEEIDRGQFQST